MEPIINAEYRLDFSGTEKENRVSREQLSRSPFGDGSALVPKHAPFFLDTVQLYDKDSSIPLVRGEDYEFVNVDHELTELAKKPVGWVIRLKRPNLDLPQMTYQTLGSVPKLTETIKYWFDATAKDDRTVWWDYVRNKPTWFNPKLHGHCLETALYNFERLAQVYEAKRETLFGEHSPIPHREFYLGQLDNLNSYIKTFYNYLNATLDRHINSNSHNTSSRLISGLHLIDNIKTATRKETTGNSDKLRVTAGNASPLLSKFNSSPINHSSGMTTESKVIYPIKDFVPYITNASNEVTLLTPLAVTVNKTGKGIGVIQTRDGDGLGLEWIVNLNPYGVEQTTHLNQWYFTHTPFLLKHKNKVVFPNCLIKGSTGNHLVVGDTVSNEWFHVNLNNSNDLNDFTVTQLNGMNGLNVNSINVVDLGNYFALYEAKTNIRTSVIFKLWLLDPKDATLGTLTLPSVSIKVNGLTESPTTHNGTVSLFQHHPVKYTHDVEYLNDERQLTLLGNNDELNIIIPVTIGYQQQPVHLDYRYTFKVTKTNPTNWELTKPYEVYQDVNLGNVIDQHRNPNSTLFKLVSNIPSSLLRPSSVITLLDEQHWVGVKKTTEANLLSFTLDTFHVTSGHRGLTFVNPDPWVSESASPCIHHGHQPIIKQELLNNTAWTLRLSLPLYAQHKGKLLKVDQDHIDLSLLRPVQGTNEIYVGVRVTETTATLVATPTTQDIQLDTLPWLTVILDNSGIINVQS